MNAPIAEFALGTVWKEKSEDVKKLVGALKLFELHHALFLRRFCLAAPKVMYLLRTSPVWKFSERLAAYDHVILKSLEKICDIKMDELAWAQASLPVAKGGLGIRRTDQVALSAYLASAYFISSLVSTICPLDWKREKNQSDSSLEATDTGSSS